MVVLPPLLYAGALVVGTVLHFVVPLRAPVPLAFRVAGVILVIVSVTVAIWGRRQMTAAGTNVNPREPTTALVTGGPFRLSRNPLYVGLTACYIGIALASGVPWLLVLLVPLLAVMHFGVVLREERYLERKFGAVYLGYKARVRRYF